LSVLPDLQKNRQELDSSIVQNF